MSLPFCSQVFRAVARTLGRVESRVSKSQDTCGVGATGILGRACHRLGERARLTEAVWKGQHSPQLVACARLLLTGFGNHLVVTC